MKFRQLKYFMAVAEELHFAKAAANLHIDSSSVSKAVKELELNLGVPLFYRGTRTVALTKEGKAFQKEVKAIFLQIEYAKKRISDGEHEQLLQIAVSPHVDCSKLAKLLKLYRKKFPFCRVGVHDASYEDTVTGLKKGVFDLGFITGDMPDYLNAGLQSEKLWSDEFIVLLPKKHPLVSFEKIPINEIFLYPLITFGPLMSDKYNVALQYYRGRNQVYPVSNYSTLLALVVAGFGISIVTQSMYINMKNEHIVVRQIAESLSADTYIYYTQKSLECEQFKNLNLSINGTYSFVDELNPSI